LEEPKHDADVNAAPLRQPILTQIVELLTCHHQVCRVGAVDPCDHVKKRGFAAARGSDNGGEFCLGYFL
jgi:hypothetical protein